MVESGYKELGGDEPTGKRITLRNMIIALVIVSVLSLITIGVLLGVVLSNASASALNGCILPETDPVDTKTMHSEIRNNFINNYYSTAGDIVLLAGLSVTVRPNCDTELRFRQESNLLYLTGVNEPDIQLTMTTGPNPVSTLYVPNEPLSQAVWIHRRLTLEQWGEKYGFDNVKYTDDLEADLTAAGAGTLYTLSDPDIVERLPFMTNYTGTIVSDNSELRANLFAARSIKTDKELALMKYANQAASAIHDKVMSHVKPGVNEAEVEAMFAYEAMACQMKWLAYPSIVGSHDNAARLHYSINDREMQDGDLLLIDAGPEYKGYSVDITRTYPINGRFTEAQREIYELVLKSNDDSQAAMAPGVDWQVIVDISRDVITQGLLDLGFFKGSFDDVKAAGVVSLFYPHGLGHFMGVDVHDGTSFPMAPLTPGMVITVEPGIYFNDELLEDVLGNSGDARNEFLVPEKIREYYDFGGVRLEDDIAITADGIENWSTSPRTVHEIEAMVQRKR